MLDGKNILVVEDDSDIRELISCNLKNEGHQVFEAKDGEVGIDKARLNLNIVSFMFEYRKNIKHLYFIL
jgi:DNA-binding response OmpR family regulator|tara:strand:+ start:733 stop:939 length:207 start_codon:yes stop_codon:yes gene_type:complete